VGNQVLFQMWAPFRQSLIRGQAFYFEQAQNRLLSQFANIEAEADRAAEEWLKQAATHFDPDRHDPGTFEEAAYDACIEFYQLLSDMRDDTILSIVAGMFHRWDKQLRDWLVREIRHWHLGANTSQKVWAADFAQIVELLECLGWNVKSQAYYKTFDAMRLVVNVYKHGEGKSLADLKRDYPAYLDDQLICDDQLVYRMEFVDHRHLKVNEVQLKEFSEAIVAFWRHVPENTLESSCTLAPSWFEKAMQKDNTAGIQWTTP
jgi:hypothetical protein